MTTTADGAAARKSNRGAARKSSTPRTRASARRPARAATVEQLSRADRVASGKDARAVAPLESHAEFSAGPGAGSGRAAAGPGGVAGAGAGAGPARADAGVPVHLLPGRGAADGGGPGRHARLGAAGAAVRRRAPVQFRGVRLAGAQPGLRRQRLRRDPARPVRVGRQAAGREPGGGRAGQRLSRQGPAQDRPGGGRRLPHRDARVRRAALPGRLVRAPGHRADPRPVQVPGQGEKVQGSREAAGQGPHPGQYPGAGQADHRGRRAAADHQRPPDDRPGRGGLRRRAGRRDLRTDPRRAGQVPAQPAVRPAAPARAVHAWCRWPARSSGSAASAPAPGSC